LMTTSTDRVHLGSNLSFYGEETIPNKDRAFFIKALFLAFTLNCLNQSIGAKSLKLALLDTGFCPSLALVNPNIIIEPVKDVTQSNTYKCHQNQLAGARFHGQRVLDLFSALYPKEAGHKKIVITPIVIFNKDGQQSFTYWNQALKLSQDHAIILAAAGLRLPEDETKRRQQSSKAPIPEGIIIVASGRVGPNIPKTTKLFPQELSSLDNMILVGSYHKPLFEKGFALKDGSLLYREAIDYYFEYSGKLSPTLKGASRALAVGGAKMLEHCAEEAGKGALDFKGCLKKKSFKISFKENLPLSKTLFSLP